MVKYYATGRPRRFYRKKRVASRTLAVQKYSVSARRMHMPLPARMCVTLRCVDNNTVSLLAAGGYDAFNFPLYFPGLWKDSAGTPAFAGGFLQLIQLYSVAWVKRVRMTTRVMAVANGTNANVNLYTYICSENIVNTLGSLTTLAEFQNNSNTYLAKKHYISAYPGGNNYVTETRSCDLTKFVGFGKQQENRIFSSYATSFTTPSAGEAINLPNYIVVMAYPLGTGNLDLNYEHIFDFDIEFNELKNLSQQITALSTPSWARRT